MSFSMRLRTMLGCFQRLLIMRSKYSSASWPTVLTPRAASMRVDLAVLLLAGHVVAEGDLGAEFLGRLAGGCGGGRSV